MRSWESKGLQNKGKKAENEQLAIYLVPLRSSTQENQKT